MSERPTPAEVELARAGLLEIAEASSVGAAFARVDEVDGVVSVLFHCTLDGYPGWHWTVSLATVDGEEPTVLEAELLPGDGALLAPDWVPWVDRLAEYQASQRADDDPDHEDSDEDDESEDEDSDDDLGDDFYDGVDIDDLAADDAEEDESDEEADGDGDEGADLDDDAAAEQREHDQHDERG